MWKDHFSLSDALREVLPSYKSRNAPKFTWVLLVYENNKNTI